MATPNTISRRLAHQFKRLVDEFSGTSVRRLIHTAKREAGTVGLARAKRAYDEGTVFLDVREVEEWREGHVRDAVHIPRGMLEFSAGKQPQLRDKRQPVIAYCTAGARSALAAQRLRELGWADVRTLDAGYQDWEDAGYPIAQGGYEDLQGDE